MQTKNIIQSSANVIRLVNLKKGDVFKKIKSDSSYNSGISYNVVVDLFNDGETTSFEVLEYTKSYSDVEAKIKIYSGTDDISIFPATIEEVSEYFDKAIKSIEEDIEKKKVELQKEIICLGKAKEFVSGELSKNLSLAEFEEMPQLEYNEQKRVKEEKLKELQGA